MKANKRKRAIEIQNDIRQILFNDWDAIRINDNSNLVDEYDSYIAPIYRVLVNSRSENELIRCLFDSSEDLNSYESSSDEIPNKSINKLRLIAQKLLEIDVII